MGMSRLRKDLFRKAHPLCIFCGGDSAAITIEHCPPRAMFQNREWPEGFEFPACEECNHGTANDDLIISFLARTDPFNDSGNRDGRLPSILGSVHQKFPTLISKMMPTARQARTANRRLGLMPAPGSTNQETGPVPVTQEMDSAVATFARKLTKAIFYIQTGTIFPVDGQIGFNWFTNADLITNNGRYPVFDLLEQLDGFAPELTRSKSVLNDQFEYKVSLSAERDLLALQARFGQGFGFVAFASTIRGRLTGMFAAVEARTGKRSPFTVI